MLEILKKGRKLNFLYFKAKTMILKFKSNKSVAKPGFKATVTGKESIFISLLRRFSHFALCLLSHFLPQQLGKEEGGKIKTTFDDKRNMEPCVKHCTAVIL